MASSAAADVSFVAYVFRDHESCRVRAPSISSSDCNSITTRCCSDARYLELLGTMTICETMDRSIDRKTEPTPPARPGDARAVVYRHPCCEKKKTALLYTRICPRRGDEGRERGDSASSFASAVLSFIVLSFIVAHARLWFCCFSWESCTSFLGIPGDRRAISASPVRFGRAVARRRRA